MSDLKQFNSFWQALDRATKLLNSDKWGCSRISDIRINPDNKLSGYIRIINYPFNYPSTWRLILFMYFFVYFSKFLRYFTKNLYINTSNPKY